MMKTTTAVYRYGDFILPPTTVSKIDISRLVHEVEWIDRELTTKLVRSKVGIKKHADLVLSEQLIDFLQQNSIDLLAIKSQERSLFIKQLRLLKEKVPVVYMTFATTADGESLGELTAWMRGSVHPQAVISVGLQPALVAGVYIRTPNRVHDFSLRSKLEESHDVLVQKLEALRG